MGFREEDAVFNTSILHLPSWLLLVLRPQRSFSMLSARYLATMPVCVDTGARVYCRWAGS